MSNMNLRQQFRKVVASTGLGWEIIEQDYVLSWALYGISNIEPLKSTLVFKGGTALKKCYFGDYRFSQDLDFSVQGDHPKGDELLALLRESCRLATEAADTFELQCRPLPAKGPHPEGQEAFEIRAQLPWQRDLVTMVKIEVTTAEKLLLKPQERKIIHLYEENLQATIYTYPLEEIIAEKIRAILQFAKKLHERGWGRSRVRDYYDLWRIFHEYGHEINQIALPDLVKQKCAHKGIQFESEEQLFQEILLKHLVEWNTWLSKVVPNLPDKDTVLNDLRVQLKRVFGTNLQNVS